MKPRCVRALKRIFILCDDDEDDALNDAELYEFQELNGGIRLTFLTWYFYLAKSYSWLEREPRRILCIIVLALLLILPSRGFKVQRLLIREK
ncbi:hypothetical protein AgCh_034652 [Apium graveolens]